MFLSVKSRIKELSLVKINLKDPYELDSQESAHELQTIQLLHGIKGTVFFLEFNRTKIIMNWRY